MSLFADLIIAAVILLALALGAKAGLVKSLAGVVVAVCSAVGASWAARMLAAPLSAKLTPLLSERLTEKLQSGGSGTVSASAGELLERFGFSGETLTRLTDQVSQSVKTTGQTVAEAVVGTVTHSIAYAVVFLLAFVLLLVVLWLVVKSLELAARLPVIRTVDALGGGALGLIKGILLTFFAVWIMRKFQLVITPELVEGSTLLKFFANNSPLSLLTGL